MVSRVDSKVNITVIPHILDFIQPAGTSRGYLKHKKLWIIHIEFHNCLGLGECSIIEGLSPDYQNDLHYENSIQKFLLALKESNLPIEKWYESLTRIIPEIVFFPSIRFGIETALLSWEKGYYFDNLFTHGKLQIPINGLIWMGNIQKMNEQVEAKINQGFRTLKFKIGPKTWREERDLLMKIRSQFKELDLTLRVDANGAFSPNEIWDVLNDLKSLEVHSIEQPVAISEPDCLSELAKANIIPIALDESLISCFTLKDKRALLDKINPQYIILKPSLHGSISGVKEWIQLAEERNIAWWMTSALESNIGLTAIAQFAGEFNISLPQGLGTGGLFKTNFSCGLSLEKGYLSHHFPEQGPSSSQLA